MKNFHLLKINLSRFSVLWVWKNLYNLCTTIPNNYCKGRRQLKTGRTGLKNIAGRLPENNRCCRTSGLKQKEEEM